MYNLHVARAKFYMILAKTNWIDRKKLLDYAHQELGFALDYVQCKKIG